jgi:hypothetical protein
VDHDVVDVWQELLGDEVHRPLDREVDHKISDGPQRHVAGVRTPTNHAFSCRVDRDGADRVRRLIARINTGLEDLSADERAHIEVAVGAVRGHRSVMIGMPRVRQAPPDLRSERPA